MLFHIWGWQCLKSGKIKSLITNERVLSANLKYNHIRWRSKLLTSEKTSKLIKLMQLMQVDLVHAECGIL